MSECIVAQLVGEEMTLRRRALVGALVLLMCTACAVRVGPGSGATALADASQDGLEQQFPVGKSTRQDVLLKLGPPHMKSKEAGFENWQYNYARSAAVAVIFIAAPVGTKKSAIFFFSEDSGVLQKIVFKTEGQ